MTHQFFFDLEGPLSPQDNGQDVLSQQLSEGDIFFEAISRYDDILYLGGRPGYEAGDTLSLVLPFLTIHATTLATIADVSKSNTTLVRGARELIAFLQSNGCSPYLITTSYQPHASHAASLLGMDGTKIRCTSLSDEDLALIAPDESHSTVSLYEDRFRDAIQSNASDSVLVSLLDEFFLSVLPGSGGRYPPDIVRPRGGRRKVSALEEIRNDRGISGADVCFMGDSITDSAVLQYVDSIGGLAIAFNANEHALRCCNVALCGDNVLAVTPILQAWMQDRMRGVYDVIASGSVAAADWARSTYAEPERANAMMEQHNWYRGTVREGAADLS